MLTGLNMERSRAIVLVFVSVVCQAAATLRAGDSGTQNALPITVGRTGVVDVESLTGQNWVVLQLSTMQHPFADCKVEYEEKLDEAQGIRRRTWTMILPSGTRKILAKHEYADGGVTLYMSLVDGENLQVLNRRQYPHMQEVEKVSLVGRQMRTTRKVVPLDGKATVGEIFVDSQTNQPVRRSFKVDSEGRLVSSESLPSGVVNETEKTVVEMEAALAGVEMEVEMLETLNDWKHVRREKYGLQENGEIKEALFNELYNVESEVRVKTWTLESPTEIEKVEFSQGVVKGTATKSLERIDKTTKAKTKEVALTSPRTKRVLFSATNGDAETFLNAFYGSDGTIRIYKEVLHKEHLGSKPLSVLVTPKGELFANGVSPTEMREATEQASAIFQSLKRLDSRIASLEKSLPSELGPR